ncbi:MAG: DUF3418 domain-containing protein [Candidatus Competibacteraceae bacterium]
MRARRDLLADEETLYRFYDARIPEGVYSGPTGDFWRNRSSGNPRLRFSTALCCWRKRAGGERRTLSRSSGSQWLETAAGEWLEPGAEDDGVTLTVPLAAVNQADPKRLDWLVPGLP